MTRTLQGFLCYLKVQNERSIDHSLIRKPDYQHQMDLFYDGFSAQGDFLVLQLMYIQMLKQLTDYRPYLSKMRKIDKAIQGKTPEYRRQVAGAGL
jgi:hypothetical protein